MSGDIESLSENAQMAEAAYADLYAGMLDFDYRKALKDSGMKQSLADIFVDKYSLVDQYTDPSTGLSATIFEKIDGGKLYFAMRGTEFDFPDVSKIDLNDILGDVDIVKTGVARDQIVSLYNYYQRLITPDTGMATQYRIIETTVMPTSGQYYEATRLVVYPAY